jgi:hypothetical protein
MTYTFIRGIMGSNLYPHKSNSRTKPSNKNSLPFLIIIHKHISITLTVNIL